MSRQERLTNFRILFKTFILFRSQGLWRSGKYLAIDAEGSRFETGSGRSVSVYFFLVWIKSFLQDKMIQIFGCSFQMRFSFLTIIFYSRNMHNSKDQLQNLTELH